VLSAGAPRMFGLSSHLVRPGTPSPILFSVVTWSPSGPHALRAVVFDLKTFFAVVPRGPVEVSPVHAGGSRQLNLESACDRIV
jgi:hypothetical protein